MKRTNNRILAIALGVLITIFVVARLFRAPKLEGNVRRELVSLDVPKITELRIASLDSSLTLLKKNNKWKVVKDEIDFEADSASVMRVLQNIQHLEATRMATRKKEKWSDFKVDSTGTHVLVYYDGEKEADFHVGKFAFDQANRQGIQPYTYLRLEGEDEVYVVDGFLSSMLPIGLNEWRKKQAPSDSIQ